MGYSIAIDGPAGAGKSTIAKKVAAKKGCCYVDTGAIYRAMAYFLLENGVKGEETDRIAKKCQEANIRVAYEAGEQQVFLNGENVNSKIRTEEVGQMASKSAAVPQAARSGGDAGCDYGRQRHWNMRSSAGDSQNLSDRIGGCTRKAPL